MKRAIISFITLTAVIVGIALYADYSDDYAEDNDDEIAEVAAVDVYKLSMKLMVPRIYDNNYSLGYRKYQSQKIVGEMYMMYSSDGSLVDIQFTNLVNKTHVMSNGKHVSYDDAYVDSTVIPRFNVIGNNKTRKFKTASICFYLAAEPSYNIGEFDEDNGLYVMLAGKGILHSKDKYLRKAKGIAAGTLGCGCMAYGHISPTRRLTYFGPGQEVDDVASVYGKWTLTFIKTKSSR